MNKDMKIVMFGAGAIGQSVGGWVAGAYDSIRFWTGMMREHEEKGITLLSREGWTGRIAVRVIDDIAEARDADVAICVKISAPPYKE